MKIYNQYFIKYTHRNKAYAGSVKCNCCLEESNFESRFPIEMKDFASWIKAFNNLHKFKGCNKKQLDIPIWASTEFKIGISV